MKTSTQLKALVRNLSKLKNVEAEVILRNFMMERLLERVAISKYRHSFILKGGMLIAAMVGIDTRTTMDLDATIKGQVLTEPEVAASTVMASQWQRYQKKYSYAADITWEMATHALKDLAGKADKV